MSQRNGGRVETEQSRLKTPASEPVHIDHDEGTVTKLIVKKVDDPLNADTRTSKIAPEPRRLDTKSLVIEEPSVTELESASSEAEPVARLEAADKKRPITKKAHEITLAKFEKKELQPSEDVKQEEQWDENKPGGWWVVIGGACLVLILMGAVILSSQWEADGMEQVEPPEIVLPTGESPFAGSPEEWFRNRAGKIPSQAALVLKQYAAAKDDQERSRWVRDPETYLKKASAWPNKLQPRPGEHNQAEHEIGHIENTGYLVLKTEDKDYMPMRVYFVRQGEELKIDWEASAAWSEMSFDEIRQKQMEYEKRSAAAANEADSQAVELPSKSFQGEVLLRCLIRRRNEFYAGPYNDIEHSEFMLGSPDMRQSFWGYVKRDSPLDLELRGLLDHGSFVVSLKNDVLVTLRVRSGKKDALPSQLEVVELVHAEWLNP